VESIADENRCATGILRVCHSKGLVVQGHDVVHEGLWLRELVLCGEHVHASHLVLAVGILEGRESCGVLDWVESLGLRMLRACEEGEDSIQKPRELSGRLHRARDD